jgi:hypothetical protein
VLRFQGRRSTVGAGLFRDGQVGIPTTILLGWLLLLSWLRGPSFLVSTLFLRGTSDGGPPPCFFHGPVGICRFCRLSEDRAGVPSEGDDCTDNEEKGDHQPEPLGGRSKWLQQRHGRCWRTDHQWCFPLRLGRERNVWRLVHDREFLAAFLTWRNGHSPAFGAFGFQPSARVKWSARMPSFRLAPVCGPVAALSQKCSGRNFY